MSDPLRFGPECIHDRHMKTKTVLAFAIAPLVIPLIFVLCDLLVPGLLSAGTPLPAAYRASEGFRIGLIAMGVGYVVTLIGAVPIHFSFVRRRWTSWWRYVCLGVFLGITPWLVYGLTLLWGTGPGASYPVFGLSVLIGLGATCGASAATIFWAITVKQ